jgi:hypothetical protein
MFPGLQTGARFFERSSLCCFGQLRDQFAQGAAFFSGRVLVDA